MKRVLWYLQENIPSVVSPDAANECPLQRRYVLDQQTCFTLRRVFLYLKVRDNE